MLARRAQAVMSSAQASGGAVSGWGCGFVASCLCKDEACLCCVYAHAELTTGMPVPRGQYACMVTKASAATSRLAVLLSSWRSALSNCTKLPGLRHLHNSMLHVTCTSCKLLMLDDAASFSSACACACVCQLSCLSSCARVPRRHLRHQQLALARKLLRSA